jgi:hypothetical protein
MRNLVHAVAVSLACVLTLAPRAALAQTQTPTPVPTPAQTPAPKPASLITYRGMETGFDVTAGRSGEVAFYIGASSTRGSLAVRFGKMDADTAVPCSASVMYEYLFRQNRTRITPVAGASIGRIFSCAGESDGTTLEPAAHALSEFSGGVRLPIFVGHHVVGSLKVLGFAQKRFGSDSAADVTSKGVTVGLVIGRR